MNTSRLHLQYMRPKWVGILKTIGWRSSHNTIRSLSENYFSTVVKETVLRLWWLSWWSTCLPCKHQDLNQIPRTYIKSPGVAAQACNFNCERPWPLGLQPCLVCWRLNSGISTYSTLLTDFYPQSSCFVFSCKFCLGSGSRVSTQTWSNWYTNCRVMYA